MTKALVHFDEGSALSEINRLKDRAVPFINENIPPVYELLEIGPLTKESFLDLLDTGEETKRIYFTSIEAQLTNGGIKNKTVRASLIRECELTFEQVLVEVSNLKSYLGFNLDGLDSLTFKKGLAKLDEVAKTDIMEKHSLYCCTEAGLQLREKHFRTIAVLDEFIDLFQKEIGRGFGLQGLGAILSVSDTGRFAVKPTILNYDALIEAGKAAAMKSAKSNAIEVEPDQVNMDSGHTPKDAHTENYKQETQSTAVNFLNFLQGSYFHTE